MKTKFLLRSGAALGVLIAAASAAPAALADTTTDVGPATVTLGGFLGVRKAFIARAAKRRISAAASAASPSPATRPAHTRNCASPPARAGSRSWPRAMPMPTRIWPSMASSTSWAAPGPANSNESNSYSPRIRNMYGTIDWDAEGIEILAGQNWSLLTLNSHGITPRNEVVARHHRGAICRGLQLGPPAATPHRQEFRSPDLAGGLGGKSPDHLRGRPGAGHAATGITVGGQPCRRFGVRQGSDDLSLNHVPDIIGKVAWEPMIGNSQPLHIEAFGLYRSFYDRVQVGATNTQGLPVGNSNANVLGRRRWRLQSPTA